MGLTCLTARVLAIALLVLGVATAHLVKTDFGFAAACLIGFAAGLVYWMIPDRKPKE